MNLNDLGLSEYEASTPQSLTVTELQMDDLPDILAIENASYTHPWTLGNFQDSLQSGYCARGLRHAGAWCAYYIAMRGVDEMHLLNITVAPLLRQQGMALCLLDDLCERARTQSLDWLWLEVRRSNLRAQNIYQQYGMRMVGERKNYYPADNGQREDALVMTLQLLPLDVE